MFSEKALPSSEDHKSACKQQHRTGEVSQEHGNAPSIRGALGSSAQCRHRRRQAEGSEAPQHGCPGSLNTLVNQPQPKIINLSLWFP